MKLTPIADTILHKRYLRTNPDTQTKETVDDMLRRIVTAVAAAEDPYTLLPGQREEMERRFYELLDRQDFLPNSPTFTGAGTELGQLSACFVLPVGDSLPDIYDTMKRAALIHQTGGGTGFAFSRLRPEGDKVKRSQGVASGPLSFLRVYNASTESIKQGGTRRGANMGILRVDHPDILDWIEAKDDTTQLTNFNLSVGITDAFMEALDTNADYDLVNPRNGETAGQLSARLVWDKLIDCAWKTGEPGVVFLDRMNRRNPNSHCETIEATNPCGEQPLPPYGSCNLGSINLGHFVMNPYQDIAAVDWDRLTEVARLGARFLDDVIDVNHYPLPEIEQKARADRRIGLGVMGWAEMLVQLRIPYDSERAVALAGVVMRHIKKAAQAESEQLAEQRGVYPEWVGSQWDKAGIKVRNATLTTVAPTGTISLLAAQPTLPCTGGIEPKFALVFVRNQAGAEMLDVDGQFETIARMEGWYSEALMRRVAESGTCQGVPGVPKEWQEVFRTAGEVRPEYHVKMQAAFQGGDDLGVSDQPVDAAVSKTVNMPNSASREDVAAVYTLAWAQGLKGVTVYRDGSRAGQVFTAGTAEKKTEPTLEPVQVAVGPVLRPRPQEANGKMFVINTHFGNMTLDVHFTDDGEPFEVIVNVGASGSDLMADAVGMGMLISRMLRLRSDVQVRQRIEIVVDTLKNIGGSSSYGFGPNRVTSLASAIARGLERYLRWSESGQSAQPNPVPRGYHLVTPMAGGAHADAEHTRHVDPCPECGSHAMAVGEGCATCHSCGASKCS